MPDPSNELSSGQRRANWVGLKTLRQRPKVVDSLPDGEPVYEVRSVRLVLRGQSPHFNRLVACERCGEMQAGAPVASQADLDTPARPVICTNCVRKAGVSSVWQPDVARAPGERAAPQGLTRQEPAPAPQPAAPPAAAAPPPAVTRDAGDDPRLRALEGRLEAMDARIEQLSRLAVAQEAALEEGRRSDEAVHTALQTALTTAVADARADAAVAAEAGASRLAALEVQLQQAVAGLTQLVEAQRADINTLAGAMGQARTELQRVVEVTQQLAQAHNRAQQGAASAQDLEGVRAVLDERLHHLTEQLAQAAGRVAAMEVRIDRMTRTPPPVPEWALPDRPGAFQLVESLEAQLQGASSRLAALSGGHQTGAESPGDQGDTPGGEGDYGVNGGG